MTAVTVREAQLADLDALLGLYRQLAEDRVESRPAGGSTAEALLQSISAQPRRSLLVAAIDRTGAVQATACRATADRAAARRAAARRAATDRAAADRAIVGTLDLLVVSNLTHQGMPWAIVENVVVDESHRGLGIGRILVEAAIDRCRQAGCYKVQLLSRTHRVGAHEFYANLGFEASAAGFRRYLS